MEHNITTSPLTPDIPVTPQPPETSTVKGPWSPGLVVAAVLVVILAFLLGSFRSNNSDLWLNLATGRLLAEKQYTFGVDPYSWASQGAYWANPSWLSSWLAYLSFITFGPMSLVIIKALLLALLAVVLLASRPKDAPILPTIELTGLAILAASPRFLTQPIVLSFLALGVLTFLLVRGNFLGGWDDNDKPARQPLWPIPLLFLLWANLDGFFVVGLFALALVVFGNILLSGTRTHGKRLAAILALSMIACAANPHMLANFTLPTEIAYMLEGILPAEWTAAGSAARELMREDTGFYGLVSPFQGNVILSPNSGWNIAGLSFFLLMAINVSSFLAAGFVPKMPGLFARGLLCLGFGMLAALQIRLIPFYALIAGPVTILNLADFLRWVRSKAATPSPQKQASPFAIGFAGFVLVIALGLAWPGWLHLGFSLFGGEVLFQSARRVSWDVEPDASLKRTAFVLSERIKAGQSGNVFNLAPDLAHYCAFFAPQVKCGLDLRLSLFATIAPAYADARNSLWEPVKTKRAEPAPPAWVEFFAKHGIDAVALTNYHRPGNPRIGPLAARLFQTSKTWDPLVADGQTLVFHWSPTNAWTGEELLARWRTDAFALHPRDQWLADDSPESPPSEPNWGDLYARGLGLIPTQTNTAIFQLGSYQKFGNFWRDPYYCAFQTAHIFPAACLSGGSTGTVLGIHGAFLVSLGDNVFRNRLGLEPSWFHSVDFGPASLPILMVRNLRTALADNPRHPSTHQLLAQGIKVTLQQEAWWNRHQAPNLRHQLRQMQIAVSLRNALNLLPQNVDLHLQLAESLHAQNFRDAALEHLGLAIKGMEELPVIDRNQQKMLADQREQLEKRFKVLEYDLRKRREDFDLKTAGAASEMDKFRMAVVQPWHFINQDNKQVDDPRGRGLVLLGLRILEKINPDSLSPDEKLERGYYLIRLNCFLGRINDAANYYRLTQKDLGILEPEAVLWIGASTGWYKNLDEALSLIERQLVGKLAGQAPSVSALAVLGLSLSSLSDSPTLPRLAHGLFTQRLITLQREILSQPVGQLADIRTLRGIFALERGDTATALNLFNQALADETPFYDRAIATRYRELLRAETAKR